MPPSRRLRVGAWEMSSPSSVMTPPSGLRMPMMASTSSAWPLPSTPAMPRTSPLWMVKPMSSSDVALDAVRVGGGQPQRRRPSSIGVVGDGGLAGLRRGQLAADHQLGELLGRGVRGVGGADRGAAADDGDLVGDRQHLAELVRDEDDGQALGLEPAQVLEERVDLLRDQDRGRLVEDEDAGAAVEDLEDLHPLAVGDAEVLDEGVGPHAEAVRVGDLLDLLPGPAADAVQLLAAEHDVLQDGEVVGEHEVLVHHADAAGDGVAGVAEGDLLAVDGDGALVRLLHAVEDLHQGGLAGAVLADEGVDGAAADGDVDVVVGDDAGEALGDAVQFDGGGRWLDALMTHSPRRGRSWRQAGGRSGRWRERTVSRLADDSTRVGTVAGENLRPHRPPGTRSDPNVLAGPGARA